MTQATQASQPLRLFQVDAFASEVFRGNPAAVVPLDTWLDDATMQKIAAENNLSETAFIALSPALAGGEEWRIRWFTPNREMDLCGHATLASAWVLFHILEPGRREVAFRSPSGLLNVHADGERLALDFPSRPPRPIDPPPGLVEALGKKPREVWRSRDLLCVFEYEGEVRSLKPDFGKVAQLEGLGVIATAKGDSVDFVSRFFAPQAGVDEDPVTGSAHCTLIPYWSKKLGKPCLEARQVSARGGELYCEDRGERVSIAGRAALYLEGTIHLP